MESARRRTALTRSQGATRGREGSPRSGSRSWSISGHSVGGWEGRRQTAVTRRTGPGEGEGGTRGRESNSHVKEFLASADKETLGTSGPTSPPLSSPSSSASGGRTPSTSASKSKRKRELVVDNGTERNNVRNMILSIETFSKPGKEEREKEEEDLLKKEEGRKNEDKQEAGSQDKVHHQHHRLKFKLPVTTVNAYLGGLELQTGQGSSQASSSSSQTLSSEGRSRSSGAGSANGKGLHAWQVQE